MAKDVRKLIIIPEYRPLFAMRKCYGPTHGPLNAPCPTPISVVGELVNQKPPYELTVMEVIKEGNGYSKPVTLTPDNYMLTYEEIAGGKVQNEPVKVTPVTPARQEVVPETITPGKSTLEPKHKVRDLSDTVYANVGVDVIHQEPEAPVEEAAVTVPDEPAPVTDSSATETPAETVTEAPAAEETPTEVTPPAEPAASEIPDRFAGMTKSERKEARRKEREAQKNS